MSEKIKEFNLKMYEGLKTIIDYGLSQDIIKEPKFYRVFYLNNQLNIVQENQVGFSENQKKDFSEQYLEYFWSEFSMGENEDKKTYKITMFFKDFDHGSGNIHVLPGMIQFWEKAEDAIDLEKSDYFVVNKGKTSEEHSNRPYIEHKGGSIFCEEGWIPCAYDIEQNEQKMAKDFYMKWDYLEKPADEIAKKLFEISDVNYVREAMKGVSAFKGICLDPKPVCNTFKELFDEIYNKEQKNKETNWTEVGGRSTYAYLKWQVYRENKEDKLSTGKMNTYYKTMYLEHYGYFVVYGVNHCINYDEKKDSPLYKQRKDIIEKMPEGPKKEDTKRNLVSGPNYVVEYNGKVYWKLMYEQINNKRIL